MVKPAKFARIGRIAADFIVMAQRLLDDYLLAVDGHPLHRSDADYHSSLS